MTTVNVMGQSTDLTMAQSKKAYAVVVLRPMPLTTTGGLYVQFMHVESTTDDIERAPATIALQIHPKGDVPYTYRNVCDRHIGPAASDIAKSAPLRIERTGSLNLLMLPAAPGRHCEQS